MDVTSEAEHQRATELEQQLQALIEQARGLILAQFGPLATAITNAEKLVAEAHTLTREFNLAEGHGWCFNEDFALSIDNKPPHWWHEVLTAGEVRVHGETEPQPAIRLQLLQNVRLRDYPAQSVVKVYRPKALQLLAQQCCYRA